MDKLSLQDIFIECNEPDNSKDVMLVNNFFQNKDLKFRPPGSAGWKNGFMVLFISQIITTLLGFLVYQTIIKHRRTQLSSLVGHGFIIPFCFYMPYTIINSMNSNNMIVRFGLVKPFVHSIFRIWEALNGFSPGGSEASLKSYLIYFTTMGEVKYDNVTKEPFRPSMKSIIKKLFHFHAGLIVLGIYSSFMYHHDFVVLDTSAPDSTFFSLWVRQAFNNIAICTLFQVYLSVLLIPESLIANFLYNVEVIEVLHNPVFSSTSVSEFWGKKWNLVIHGMLKRGVFKPARRYMSSKMAVVWTFLVSGIIHEWILTVLLMSKNKYTCDNGTPMLQCITRNIHLNQTKFFTWHGIVVGLESVLFKMKYVKQFREKSPAWVLTLLIWLLMFPCAHWYFDDYIESGFFHHGQLGIPTLILE